MPIGDVRLDDSQLNDRLAVLRRNANDLEPSGVACKLVIPNSQVLFTEIEAPGPDTKGRIAQIREGLVGLTPYDVNDLVFDWRMQGTRAQVAVVARETLTEAEGFATEFRFNPMSYVAMPEDPSEFDGEPFFGPTAHAKATLSAEDRVEPDVAPISIIETGRRPKARAVKPAPLAVPMPETPEVPSPKITAPMTADAAPSAGFASRRGGVSTMPKAQPELALEGTAPEPIVAPEPMVEAEAPVPPAQNPDAAPKANPETDPLPITFSSRRTVKPGPKRAAIPGPIVAPEPQDTPLPARPGVAFSALDLDDVPDLPSWSRDGGDRSVTPMAMTAGITADPRPIAALPGAGAGMRDAAKSAGSAIAGTIGKVGAPMARMKRRNDSRAESLAEAQAMSIFGARPVAKPGSSRRIGLALIAVLLVGLGVAALWSLLFLGSDGPEEIANAPAAPQQIAAVNPAAPAEDIVAPQPLDAGLPSVTPEIAPDVAVAAPRVGEPPLGQGSDLAPGLATAPALPSAPAAPSAPASGLAAPSIDRAVETALIAPALESALPNTEPAAPLSILPQSGGPSAGSETQDVVPAAPAVDVARLQDATSDVLASAPAPDRISQPAPTLAEAERSYAATGIWQLDPTPLLEPRGGDGLEQLLLASIDPTLDFAAQPTQFDRSQPDTRPEPVVVAPRPLLQSYDLDDRGLVRAAPEGTESPDGVMVYLGKPALVPGVRPGTPPPALPVPEPEIAALPVPAPEAPQVIAPEVVPEIVPEAPDAPVVLDTPQGRSQDASIAAVIPETGNPDLAVPGTDGQDAAALPQTGAPDSTAPDTNAPLNSIAAVALAPEVAEGNDPVLPEALPLTPEQERLRQIRPMPRPGSVVEQSDPSGGFAASALAQIRPAVRPLSLQERAEPEVTGGTELAIAVSPQPALRPVRAASTNSAAPDASLRNASTSAVALEQPQQRNDTSTGGNQDDGLDNNVAAAVVPTIPSRASVTQAATEQNAISLGKVNLIGVYGSESERRALVRLKSGRYIKVEVGDAVDGGRVAAIGEDELRYIKGGRNITLKMPKG